MQEKEINIFDVPLLSDEQCREIFLRARWQDGVPRCPSCGGDELYSLPKRKVWRCKNTGRKKGCSDFSVFGGTSFASQKIGFKRLLLQVMLFAGAPKGKASTLLCADMDINQRTAFVTMHKLRHLIVEEQSSLVLHGIVEIDGAVFGGHQKKANSVNPLSGNNMRVIRNRGRNRRVVVVMRQRGGRSVTAVVRKESDAIGRIIQQVSPTAIIQSDQARAWDSLNELFHTMRINHKYSFSANMACTNNAEQFFAMLRRMHVGIYHQFSAKYIYLYAAEMAWKMDFARLTNWGRTQKLLHMAMAPCRDNIFAGYWQKHAIPTIIEEKLRLVELNERIDARAA